MPGSAAAPAASLLAAASISCSTPSASHFAFGKAELRHRFVLEGSRAFGVSYVYANLLGNEAGRAIYDGGGAHRFGRQARGCGRPIFICRLAVDLGSGRYRCHADATGADRQLRRQIRERYGIVEISFDFPHQPPTPVDIKRDGWETGPHIKEEEFSRAVALGLFDYMRKSRSSGVVVSASGGADSSAVACLAAMMVDLGVNELGRARFLEKLGYIKQLEHVASNAEIIKQLVTCVYQSTQNSTETTRSAAAGVAREIGAEFYEFDVDNLVREYVAMVSRAVGRDLTWEQDDLALQNIQARVRAPGVWMLANLRRGLLLSTSNRSEAAVGYATMDGDTSGGLCPIAGIDKAYLRQWLKWLEHAGPAGGRPIKALAAVNCQPPTAELRPTESGQTDEADLMPYELLDAIERAAIRDKLSPVEVFQQMHPRFPQYSAAQLGEWVERFFRLWCRTNGSASGTPLRSTWTMKTSTRKPGAASPILSGGYERELAALRTYVAKQG